MRAICGAAALLLMGGIAAQATPEVGQAYSYERKGKSPRTFVYEGESGGLHRFVEQGGKGLVFGFDGDGNLAARDRANDDKGMIPYDTPDFIRLTGPSTYSFGYIWNGTNRGVTCERDVTDGNGEVICRDLKAGASYAMRYTMPIINGMTAGLERYNEATREAEQVWSLRPISQ